MAWHGKARLGMARRGLAWRGEGNMIYFIRQCGTNLVKIGMTQREITKRLAELQTGCGHKLEILAVTEGNDVEEAQYHRMYYEYKAAGGDEWFDLPDEIINQLRKDKGNGRNKEDSSGITGDSAFDVRPVCRRQQYQAASTGENVSRRSSVFDDTKREHLFSFMRHKHG
jgi:hypothetical protein